MKTKTLLLFAPLALFILFFRVGYSKNLSTDESKCDLLVRQLVDLKGIEKCCIFDDRKVKSRIIDSLKTKLTKLSPMVSLVNNGKLASNWKKFVKKISVSSVPKYWTKSREEQGILNTASGDTLLVFAYNPQKDQKSFEHNVRRAYYGLARYTCLPKLLLISMTNKAQVSYRRTFNFLTRTVRIVDVDILEISRVAKKKKGKKSKISSHHFTVHQCNPFSRVYEKRKLAKTNKWFQSKLMNLHGYSIFIKPLHFPDDRVFLNNKSFVAATANSWNENSKMGVTFRSLMNFTYKYNYNYQDITFIEVYLDPYRRIATLKPSMFQTVDIYTPVIFDTSIEVKLLNFLMSFPLILVIALLLKLISRLSDFDSQTWSIVAVFKMLLGLDNPTGKTNSFLESALFILISIAGVFYSNEFSEAATSILNPIKLERHFGSFNDMKESNLTIHLYDNLVSYSKYCGRIENPIRTSKIKTKLQENSIVDEIGEMLCSTKIAVSKAESPAFVPFFGAAIRVDGATLARKSGLIELKRVVALRVKSFSPYNERMSELYWRFHESGFHNLDKKELINEIKKHVANQYYSKKSPNPTDDFENGASGFSYVLFMILLVGSVSAIIALIVEILIFRCSSRVEPSIPREEFEVNFRVGTPIFISKDYLEDATSDIESIDEDDSDTTLGSFEEAGVNCSTPSPTIIRRNVPLNEPSTSTTEVLVHATE